MRSNFLHAVLAARAGSRGPRSAERVWNALSSFEKAQLEREVDALAARGVRAVPSAVGPLFHTGPYASIGRQVLAVCSQREAGGAAVRLAEHAAATAVRSGLTVLAGDTGDTGDLSAAGAAPAPEDAAVLAALRSGGTVVSVLAEGMRATAATRPHPRLVTVSPCAPGRPWSVETAMLRNATIAELCTAMVAIGAAGTGATIDAGMRALAAGRPVLAVGATAGSRLLVDYGATAAKDEVELTWWLGTRLNAERRDRPLAAPPDPERGRSLDVALRPTAIWRGAARQWSTA